MGVSLRVGLTSSPRSFLTAGFPLPSLTRLTHSVADAPNVTSLKTYGCKSLFLPSQKLLFCKDVCIDKLQTGRGVLLCYNIKAISPKHAPFHLTTTLSRSNSTLEKGRGVSFRNITLINPPNSPRFTPNHPYSTPKPHYFNPSAL